MGRTAVGYPLLIPAFFGLEHYGSIPGLIRLATVTSFGAGPRLAGAAYELAGRDDPAFTLTRDARWRRHCSG